MKLFKLTGYQSTIKLSLKQPIQQHNTQNWMQKKQAGLACSVLWTRRLKHYKCKMLKRYFNTTFTHKPQNSGST